jgi:hypothetical protein
VLHDLDTTLKTLLAREVPALADDRVYFDPPGADFKPSIPAINLFLYDVRENRELRSNEWLQERQGNGTVSRRRSPVRVDCAYLITAWAGDAASEHRLLGQVMLALLRYPHIPPTLLQGSLAGQEPLATTALQASNLQSLGEFWQAMDNKPRAALAYTVTISLDPFEAFEAPPVLEHLIAIEQANRNTKG